MILRRRVERSRGTWQLTLPTAQARRAIEIPKGSLRLPDELADLLFAFLRGREPVAIAKLRTERRPYHIIEQERVLAELTVDRVAMLEDRHIRKRFSEIEIELVDGTQKNLKAITNQLKELGAQNGIFRPTLYQALSVDYPDSQQTIEQTAPSVEHVQRTFQQQVHDIFRHDPVTRLGQDPEDLHRMRVATRRARALLRTARPILEPAWCMDLRNEIGWLTKVLGSVRDFDVLLQKLRQETSTLTSTEQKLFDALLLQLESRQSNVRTSMIETLRGERYLAFLDRLISASQRMEVIHSNISLQTLVGKAFDKLEKSVDNLPNEYTDEDLHNLRKRAKHVRYAAELAEPCVGKPATRFIRQMRKFQDLLGAHQDTVMIEQHLQHFLRSSRGVKTAFTIGLVVERLRRRRARLRATFPHRWGKLKRQGNRVWR